MARKDKAKKLAGWDQRLFEIRTLLFFTAEEFDDWCREVQSTDVCGKALSKAAKFFHLDERKRTHQKLLLFILADVLFGNSGPTGRPKKWADRTVELLLDRAQVTSGDERVSDSAAAVMMKQQFRERYRHDDPKVLRKQLSAARRRYESQPRMWQEMMRQSLPNVQ